MLRRSANAPVMPLSTRSVLPPRGHQVDKVVQDLKEDASVAAARVKKGIQVSRRVSGSMGGGLEQHSYASDGVSTVKI